MTIMKQIVFLNFQEIFSLILVWLVGTWNVFKFVSMNDLLIMNNTNQNHYNSNTELNL